MKGGLGRQDGFTLLEMLVALVVFGLLMAGLSQTVRYGLAAWSAQARAATGPATFAAVDGAIRRLIAQAAPDGFAGAAEGLAFTTRLPVGSGVGDRLADVALLVEPGGRLVLRWRPHPSGIALGPSPPARTEPLLNDVSSLRFSYYVRPLSGPPGWTESWKNRGLPLLVRINIRFAGREHWPDLVVAPVASGG